MVIKLKRTGNLISFLEQVHKLFITFLGEKL